MGTQLGPREGVDCGETFFACGRPRSRRPPERQRKLALGLLRWRSPGALGTWVGTGGGQWRAQRRGSPGFLNPGRKVHARISWWSW